MTPVFAYYTDLLSRGSDTDRVLFNGVADRLTEWFEHDIGNDHKLAFDGQLQFQLPISYTARREQVDVHHELYSVHYKHPNAERTLLYELKVDLVRVPQGVQFALRVEGGTMLAGMEPVEVVPYLPAILRVLPAAANLQVLGEPVPVAPVRLEERFVARWIETH